MFVSTRRTLAAGAAAATTLALLAGCGSSSGSGTASSSQSPKQEFASAISSLNDGDTLLATFRVDAPAAALLGLASNSGDVTPSDRRAIAVVAGGDITVEVKGDKNLSSYKPGDKQHPAVEFKVDSNGSSIVDVRSVDQTAYFHVDVSKILQIAGQPASKLTDLQRQIPPTLGFAKDLLAGKWVSLNLPQAQTLLKSISGAAGAQAPSAKQGQQLVNRLKATLLADTTVTRPSTGGDQGDHLVLTARTRQVLTDVASDLSSVLPSQAFSQFRPSDVPDRTVTIDAYVKDGILSKLSLETTQFASAADKAKLNGTKVPLVLTFDTSGPSIDAPSGATPIDLSKLGGLLGQLGAASSSASGSATAG